MANVRCAQCAQQFQAQAWTRACPHCGAEKAARCVICDTPVDLPTRTCDIHRAAPSDALALTPPAGPAHTPPAAPTYERPAWPPSPVAAGDLIPAPRPTRRRWPLAVLAVVLVGAAAGGGVLAVGTLGQSDYPKSWDPRVKDLAAFVERERGLPFSHPVRVDFLSDAEFRRQATEHEDLTVEEKAEVERSEAMLRAVGLLHGDVDLVEIGEELVGDGAVGQYRFEDERISVRGETLDDERRATLVHELTHALQDQNFNLGDVEPENSGAELAFTAVVEADADEVEEAWIDTLSDDARNALQDAQDDTAGEADFKGVPDVFIELMGFPYAFGPGLLHAVIADAGQAGRNELFTRPPVSEEQVILPSAYLDDEAVEKVVTPALAAGETMIEDSDGDFGMVSLLVVLAERIDYSVAWKSVQGWAGDAVVAFERGDDTCVRIDVVFDEAPQAEQFESAFAEWAKGYPATSSHTDRTARLESCDPGTKGAGRAEGHVSGIEGLSIRGALIESLSEAGVPADRTGCIADGALDRVTANRFLELDRQLTENPTSAAITEVQTATARAAKACGG